MASRIRLRNGLIDAYDRVDLEIVARILVLGVPGLVAHLHLLSNHEVILGVDLAAGKGSADVWTCDFSADYVRINVDYRS